MIDFDGFEVMTFDCYGTLIDWETGIVQALRPVLQARGAHPSDDELLEAFGSLEEEAERGIYRSYREILAGIIQGLGGRYGFEPSPDECGRFSASVGDWPAFPDSAEALARLKRRFKLAVITNCDDDLFAQSNRRLGVAFDWVITAQQARSYKPSPHNFQVAFERIGIPPARILHVAQSLYHDHAPAKRLGLTTVWINRRHGRPGFGATPPAEVAPDLELPDLRSLADLAADHGQ